MKKFIVLVLPVFLFLAGCKEIVSAPTPEYKIIEQHDKIEIRAYDSMIVAETETAGERGEAINQGFRILADYIFGNNTAKEKVAMTAPVIQKTSAPVSESTSEKIAMTAPVIQTTSDSTAKSWKTTFIMPDNYTMQTLPKPNDSRVKIVSVPTQKYVAIRFSGFNTDASLKKHTALLDDFVKSKKLKVDGDPVYAFYNPPWTLPMLKRNEVMYRLAQP